MSDCHWCKEADKEIAELKLQVGEARKLLIEFTTDAAVCLAIASRCIGGHQEDPCKCLYCRARQQIFQMDEVAEKQAAPLPKNEESDGSNNVAGGCDYA